MGRASASANSMTPGCQTHRWGEHPLCQPSNVLFLEASDGASIHRSQSGNVRFLEKQASSVHETHVLQKQACTVGLHATAKRTFLQTNAAVMGFQAPPFPALQIQNARKKFGFGIMCPHLLCCLCERAGLLSPVLPCFTTHGPWSRLLTQGSYSVLKGYWANIRSFDHGSVERFTPYVQCFGGVDPKKPEHLNGA